jgi:hypothetical protein
MPARRRDPPVEFDQACRHQAGRAHALERRRRDDTVAQPRRAEAGAKGSACMVPSQCPVTRLGQAAATIVRSRLGAVAG